MDKLIQRNSFLYVLLLIVIFSCTKKADSISESDAQDCRIKSLHISNGENYEYEYDSLNHLKKITFTIGTGGNVLSYIQKNNVFL